MRRLTFKLGIPMASGRGLRNLLRLAERRAGGWIEAVDRSKAAVS